MKRRVYTITIGNEAKSYPNEYCYNYGNTKDIVLKLAKNKAQVVINMTISINAYDFSQKAIFSDAIKRVCWRHLLKYGKNIKIQSVSINDSKLNISQTIYIPKVYSMIPDKSSVMIAPLSSNNGIIQQLITEPFYKQNNKTAFVISLMISKSKEYIFEKFLYLWMSYNSFYSSLFNIDKDQLPQNYLHDFMNDCYEKKVSSNELKKNSKTEYCHISYVLHKYGFGHRMMIQSQRNTNIPSIMGFITKNAISFSNIASLNDTVKNEFNSLLENYNIYSNYNYYGFLISDYVYYLRCKYLHGEKPPKMLAYHNDKELIRIRVAVNVLENFLESHLVDLYQ